MSKAVIPAKAGTQKTSVIPAKAGTQAAAVIPAGAAVIPAKAGTQGVENQGAEALDSRLRGNDGNAEALDSRLRGNDEGRLRGNDANAKALHSSLRANDDHLPILGLMLGDMTGIGPEISARLLAGKTLSSVARIVVIGDERVFKLGCADAGVSPAYRTYPSVSAIDWTRDEIPLIDLRNIDPTTIKRAEMSPESGRLTGETLKHMIDLALAGELDGISFAPLNKAALHRGGWNYPDEHQMFAALTQHEGFFGEMNVIKEFATFRVTSHVSLRKAIDLVTPERITSAVRLAHETLKATGIASPRIAVAALNPHNGEGGLFGDEEIRIIRPTVDKLRAEGVGCVGPVSSDVIFLEALKGEYDGVVMMYHDQGQIATKLLGFNKGVTVTAGLKTVFTTPAHGTAFDIVGQGKADTGALEQAVRIAARMAVARKQTMKAD